MTDDSVYNLARRAGIVVDWRDYANRPHRVSLDTLRCVLAALGLPCETADDLSHSRRSLDEHVVPPLITATVGQPVHLPVEGDSRPRLRVAYDDGDVADFPVQANAARHRVIPYLKRPVITSSRSGQNA